LRRTTMRVRDWMKNEVATCTPGDGLDGAVKVMKDEGYGCIVVVDERRRPVGIVTDRDASMTALTSGRPLREFRVSDAMSSPTTNCLQEDDVAQAASTMGRLRIRRLPVVNRGGFLVGLLALDDLARRTARDPDSSRCDQEPQTPVRHRVGSLAARQADAEC
jgi:CBS domain-containing protein